MVINWVSLGLCILGHNTPKNNKLILHKWKSGSTENDFDFWVDYLITSNLYQNCSLVNLKIDWDSSVIDSNVIPRSQATQLVRKIGNQNQSVNICSPRI